MPVKVLASEVGVAPQVAHLRTICGIVHDVQLKWTPVNELVAMLVWPRHQNSSAATTQVEGVRCQFRMVMNTQCCRLQRLHTSWLHQAFNGQ